MDRVPSSSSSSGAPTPDRYYGYKDIAEFCQFVVSDLFEIKSADHEPGVDTPPRSPSCKPACPKLLDFIAYALYRTRLPVAITHQALLLLQRLKQRYPSARGTTSSPHRLFLSSLMLSSKSSMDDTYSNKSWVIVGGNFFGLREVNQMERELFAFLDFNVVATKDQLETFVSDKQARFLRARSRASSPVPSSALPPSPPYSFNDVEQRKRRRSDSVATDQFTREEEALRHKRAADAAIALLRPPHATRVKMIARQHSQQRRSSPGWANHLRKVRDTEACSASCSGTSSPADQSSGSCSSSSGSSSMWSSADCSPYSTSPPSPASTSSLRTPPDLGETCDRFAAFGKQHQKTSPLAQSFNYSAPGIVDNYHCTTLATPPSST